MNLNYKNHLENRKYDFIRFLLVILCLAIIFSFSGCGGRSTTIQIVTTTPTPNSEVKNTLTKTEIANEIDEGLQSGDYYVATFYDEDNDCCTTFYELPIKYEEATKSSKSDYNEIAESFKPLAELNYSIYSNYGYEIECVVVLVSSDGYVIMGVNNFDETVFSW